MEKNLLRVIKSLGREPTSTSFGWTSFSMLNPRLNLEEIRLLFRYLADNFQQPLIVVNDYLYRHNIKMSYNVNEQVATQLIDSFNANHQARLLELLKQEKLLHKVRVQEWKELFPELGIQSTIRELHDLCLSRAEFRDDVHTTVKNFTGEQLNRKNVSAHLTKACWYQTDFLIEQLAFSLQLSLGCNYHFQLCAEPCPSILERLIKREYGDIDLHFDRLGYLQLGVKPGLKNLH